MAQHGFKLAQDGPKMAFRWPQHGHKMAQDGPRWPQDGSNMDPRWPKVAQDSPKWARQGPKKPNNGSKMALRWHRKAPRGPKMAPKRPMMASRWPQDVLQMVPDSRARVEHIFVLPFFVTASIAEIGDYFVLQFFRSRVYRLFTRQYIKQQHDPRFTVFS